MTAAPAPTAQDQPHTFTTATLDKHVGIACSCGAISGWTNSKGATTWKAQHRAPAPLDYLGTIPTTIPAGHVVVHNSVRPTRRLGSRGFRAWLEEAGVPRRTSCDCGWAPELGQHFHVVPEV